MKLSSHHWALLIIFVMTLPFVNPWVRGDGAGYYAYARALLVERHLSFENDWRMANLSFHMYVVDVEGHIDHTGYTNTGRLNIRYAVGASSRLFSANAIYFFATTVAFLPTLITRQIIYGHPMEFGYGDFGSSHWAHPVGFRTSARIGAEGVTRYPCDTVW